MKTSLRRRWRDLKRATDYLVTVMRTRAPRLTYVGGWLGHRNLGDEALRAACAQLFPEFGLMECPVDTPKLALQSCHWIGANTVAVLAGGTLIGRLDADVLARIFKRFPISFVFGSGVLNPGFWAEKDSSFKSRLDKWKPVLERCDYVGVRGPMSAEVLTGMGVHHVEVIGDPVLVFADDHVATIPERDAPSLGLNVGHSNGVVWGSEERMCEQFTRLAKAAKRSGWKVQWFVVWDGDLETTLRVAAASDTTDHIYRIYDDHREFMRLVRPLSAFVGMKLHAVVLSTCAYVPSIMVEYRPKCRDYMKSIRQEEFAFRGDNFDGALAWEIVKSGGLDRDAHRRSIHAAIQPLVALQRLRAGQIMRAMIGDRNVRSATKASQPTGTVPTVPDMTQRDS